MNWGWAWWMYLTGFARSVWVGQVFFIGPDGES